MFGQFIYLSHKNMKKSAFQKIWVLFFLFFNYACHETKTNNEFFSLRVRDVINEKPAKFYLYKLSDSIEYVRLETTPVVTLRFIQKLHITNQHIYVSDRKGLYKFARNGEFIEEIGRIGSGPGEHNGNIRFAICEKNNEIYVYNNLTNIIVYDLNSGFLLRDFLVENHACNISILGEDKIALLTWDPDIGLGLDEIVLFDRNGEKTDVIRNSHRSRVSGNVSAYASEYKMNDELRYSYIYNDTMYSIRSDFTRYPYAVFQLKNKIMRHELKVLPNEINHPDLLAISRISESNQFLFLTVQKGIYGGIQQELTHMVFDKNSNELKPVNSFINDLDGGMDFWPKWISNGIMVDFYPAYSVIDHHKNNISDKFSPSLSFTQLVENLNEYDNPVLVLIK